MSLLNSLAAQNAYVSRLKWDINFGESTELNVGATVINFYQTFIMFDISHLPLETKITQALMNLYLLNASQLSVSKVIGAYPVLQPWLENEITYGNQPLYEDNPVAEAVVTNQAGTFISWDITALVKDWHSGALANYGLALVSTDPPVVFASSENISTSLRIQPLLTVEFQPATYSFVSDAERNLATTDEIQFSALYNTSGLNMVSFFVSNTGANDVTVELKVSPDGSVFLVDSLKNIAPGQSAVLVPQVFTEFARVDYKSTNLGQPSIIDIWFQGQGS